MLVGSQALKHWFTDFPRAPKDWDWKVSPRYDTGSKPGEDIFWHESFPSAWDGWHIAEPDLLYTIKVSHAFWDVAGSWNKHMADILWMQKNTDVTFDRAAYDILYPVWKAKHGKPRANLAMTKEQFFADAVKRKYDHDSLHDSVAYDDVPMYTRILKDGEDVLVDNAKFWDMSEEDKFKTIREEVYATALERWVIPSNYMCSPRAAYAKAMKKTITSLFKGEWALYTVLNYQHVYAPDMDYVAHHKSKSDRLIAL